MNTTFEQVFHRRIRKLISIFLFFLHTSIFAIFIFFSEHEVYKEFYNLTKSPQRSFILFKAKDSGSMLRLNQINDVLSLDKRFISVLKTKDPKTGIRGCDPLCDLNVPFHLVSVSY